ncbi:unnamed protein product [Dicrocoelium dendriticum]|nr:unnamed protein product [Dicrocoelium dendriticum]
MPLSWRARLAYSVGHVLNDLCASVWFTYTLVFFKFGVNIPTSLAGTIVLLGQVADGLATLFVGYFSDRTNDHGDHQLVTSDQLSQTMDNASDHGLVSFRSSRNYRFSSWCPAGRKRWHLAGSLIVLFSFPLLFGSPVGAMNASTLAKMIYYCPVVILFQIGWAYVQVTHLALMNDLTLNPGERTLLTSLRYLFTVLSNLAVYLSTYFLLLGRNSDQLQDSVVPPSVTPLVHTSWHLNPALVLASHPRLKWLSSNQEEPEEVVDFGREDLPVFRNLSLVIVGAGALMTVLFHVGVRNSDQIPVLHLSYESIPPASDQPQAAGDSPASSRLPRLQISSWKSWLRLPLFWTQGFFYMTVRVIVNVSQLPRLPTRRILRRIYNCDPRLLGTLLLHGCR